MPHPQVYRWSHRCLGWTGAEYPGRSLQQLPSPSRDLVRMHIKLLRQLSQHLVALDRRQGNLRLERRGVVPSGPLRHLAAALRRRKRPPGGPAKHPGSEKQCLVQKKTLWFRKTKFLSENQELMSHGSRYLRSYFPGGWAAKHCGSEKNIVVQNFKVFI